jgi:hypothetical protein
LGVIAGAGAASCVHAALFRATGCNGLRTDALAALRAREIVSPSSGSVSDSEAEEARNSLASRKTMSSRSSSASSSSSCFVVSCSRVRHDNMGIAHRRGLREVTQDLLRRPFRHGEASERTRRAKLQPRKQDRVTRAPAVPDWLLATTIAVLVTQVSHVASSLG